MTESSEGFRYTNALSLQSSGKQVMLGTASHRKPKNKSVHNDGYQIFGKLYGRQSPKNFARPSAHFLTVSVCFWREHIGGLTFSFNSICINTGFSACWLQKYGSKIDTMTFLSVLSSKETVLLIKLSKWLNGFTPNFISLARKPWVPSLDYDLLAPTIWCLFPI